jgi:protein phosphatase
MRVLGDVDATPEIDTSIMETHVGDRWLLCSDGLSSYVTEEKIRSALTSSGTLGDLAERLVKEALDQGAPDNVTAVLVDIDGSGVASHVPPLTVGSAASPLVFDGDSIKKAVRLPALLLHPLKTSKNVDSHFEPESDDFLAEMITEDRQRGKRRKVIWLVGLALAALALLILLLVGYHWTQNHYYVGSNGSTVVIYRGVQQSIGPISLSSVYRETDVPVSGLTDYSRSTLERTINASSLRDAERIVSQLAESSGR